MPATKSHKLIPAVLLALTLCATACSQLPDRAGGGVAQDVKVLTFADTAGSAQRTSTSGLMRSSDAPATRCVSSFPIGGETVTLDMSQARFATSRPARSMGLLSGPGCSTGLE